MPDDRRTLARLLAAHAAVEVALERKLILVDVLRTRGHHDRAAAAGLAAVAYTDRLAAIARQSRRLIKAEAAAFRDRLERRIAHRVNEAGEDTPASPAAGLSVGEIYGLMEDAESEAKAGPHPDAPEAA